MQWTVAINYDYAFYIVDNLITHSGKDHIIRLVLAQLDIYLNLVSKQHAEEFDFEGEHEIIKYEITDNNICWKYDEQSFSQNIAEIKEELTTSSTSNFGDVCIVIWETPSDMLNSESKARFLFMTDGFNL